jgi:hypothetical protein
MAAITAALYERPVITPVRSAGHLRLIHGQGGGAEDGAAPCLV